MSVTEQAWEEFSGQLKGFILRRVPDPMDAEDILQEVFVKLHTRIDTLRDERRLAPWLYTITRNAITDYYRQRRPLVELPDELLAEAELEEPEPIAQLAAGVETMLRCLPDKYRQALQWVELDGLSQGEMAERAGLSLSGAKSRVQRGRDKLRDCLLDCCHFEFDRRGLPIDYTPRPDCCRQCRS
jgi:RNA polymerase sigma-70 factor (ECF subfamily)